MKTIDEATVLAHGNAMLAELGIPPCDDTSALAMEVLDWRAAYAAALQKLTSLEKMLGAPCQSPPNLRMVRARIIGLLEANGPLSGRQIVAALADEIPENRVRAQIWYLNHHERCIMDGRGGWRIRYVSDRHADEDYPIRRGD